MAAQHPHLHWTLRNLRSAGDRTQSPTRGPPSSLVYLLCLGFEALGRGSAWARPWGQGQGPAGLLEVSVCRLVRDGCADGQVPSFY